MLTPGIGDLLRMNELTKEETESKRTYKSRVDNVLDHALSIEIPLDESSGSMKAFSVGTELNVYYFGPDGSRYIFRSQVIDRQNDDIPCLIISFPNEDEIQRIQRRNYLRVASSLEISVKGTGERLYHFLAKTVDVSGGGIAFTCKAQYRIEHGYLLSCWLVVPLQKGIEHVPFIGKVVRVVPPKVEGGEQMVSIMFKDIKEPDRERIIRYCFERQVALRMKGAL